MTTLSTIFEGRGLQFDYFSEIVTLDNDNIITIYSVILKDEESKIFAGEHFHLFHFGVAPFKFGLSNPYETQERKTEYAFKDAVAKAIYNAWHE